MNRIKYYLLRPTLNRRLVAMMLFLSLSLISILIFLYYQTEKVMYNEFERQTSALTKSIQIGLEEASCQRNASRITLSNLIQKG